MVNSGSTYLWTGSDGTDWNNPNNWLLLNGSTITSETGVPTAEDTALIIDGHTLREAGYLLENNTDPNAVDNNNIVKNNTPNINSSTPVEVGNVIIGGMGAASKITTNDTSFTVLGTFEDAKTGGVSNAQAGNYELTGNNIHIVHYQFSSDATNTQIGTSESPAKITVDWLSGAPENTNAGQGTTLTVTQGYDLDSNGQPALRNGVNGNNNWTIIYGENATGRKPGEVCFLAGSMIRTANGDLAVEDITIGDQVVAFDWKNNRNILRSVVWVGTARAVVRPHLADDEAGWPVRVLKDAIADGVPYKDMLITAEHCLFFEDRFVPVRMLVNGPTIFYDKSILSYDYYHVETELHSVITADGMLTESYLDTGNRSSFRQDGKVATLRSTARSWQDDAGAPLCVDRSFVQPLFHVMEHREKSIEQALPAPEKAALVHDADLRLITDKGATLRPVRCRDEQYSFMLPSGTQSVRILSRASRPTDVIGPFVDDRRQMGVAVGEVSLVTAKGQQTVTTHLQENKPEGWHADMGWNGVAWTNGNALLPLDAQQVEGDMALLSLTIRAAGPYLAADTTKQAVQATSIA